MCGNNCNIITGVTITFDAAGPAVTVEPKGSTPPGDPPTPADVKTAAEREYAARMEGGGCAKGCKCNALPGSAPTTIDHNVPAGQPWEPFTLFFPPLPADVMAPDKHHPRYVAKGNYHAKYTTQAGICEPNLNVAAPK